MTQSMFLVVALLVVVIVVLWSRGSAGAGPESRLLRICQGDTAQAERLLQAELSRSPAISRAEAAARAVQRLQRDNR
jgi:hypothetical protein